MSDGEKVQHADNHDMKLTPLNLIHNAFSIALLCFSIAIVTALFVRWKHSSIARDANPWVALVVCIHAIIWLSMIEGEQASLVGLPPVDTELYKVTQPLTYKCAAAATAFKGDNCQFMVRLVVFVVNQCCSTISPKDEVLVLPDWVKFIFLEIGLASIISPAF